MRGGFDERDKRRPSMIVGICIEGQNNEASKSIKMILNDEELEEIANFDALDQRGATLSVNNPVSNEVEVFLNNMDNEGIES